jgi:GTP-binding protein
LLDDELKEEIKLDLPNGVDALFISSINQQGLQILKDKLWDEINFDPF